MIKFIFQVFLIFLLISCGEKKLEKTNSVEKTDTVTLSEKCFQNFSLQEKQNKDSVTLLVSSEESPFFLYSIKFLDSKFSEEDFDPFSYDFPSNIRQEVRIDSSTIRLDTLKLYNKVNDNTSGISILGMWMGDSECMLKKITENNESYFLIRGLNPQCNGNHCRSYNVVLLKKKANYLMGTGIFYSGRILFEDIHIYKYNDNLFIPIEATEKGNIKKINISLDELLGKRSN